MNTSICACLLLGCLGQVADSGPANADTLVVCAAPLRAELAPWLQHRRRQGYRPHVIDRQATADRLRQQIRAAAKRSEIRHLVLVGDADSDAASSSQTVPAQRVAARINVQYGSESHIGTDNWYADLDDDGLPDLTVGRLSVDSPAQLREVVAKILAYESQRGGDQDWKRRIRVVAGVGGFGLLVDSVIETVTKKFLTDGIPASYVTDVAYGSWSSPYCPDPSRFGDTAIRGMNEGALFWVYMGHGSRHQLDRLRVPGGSFPIFGSREVSQINCRNGSPIALLLACYSGAFDVPGDCLGEQMLRRPGGPVAIIGGSRITMPYANAVFGSALMDECFRKRRRTLGEVMLHAKRRLGSSGYAATGIAQQNRQLLDGLARMLSPKPEQIAGERFEHVYLYNLLGDPLLQLPHPKSLSVKASRRVDAGGQLDVQVTTPLAGQATVEFVCRRDRTKEPPPKRLQFDRRPEALRQFDAVYRQANDSIWSKAQITVEAGEFSLPLGVPAQAKGPCHVRITVQSAEGFAAGATDVYVRAVEVD